MKTMVVRTVNKTRCTAFDTVEGGDTYTIEIDGRIGAPRLATIARKRFGPTYAVRGVETVSVKYGMPLDVFFDTAEIIEETEIER